MVLADVANASLQAGRGNIYVINDNTGRDFGFARAGGWDGLISLDLVRDPARSRDMPWLPTPLPGTERQVALGDVQVSDILLVSIIQAPIGVDLDPYSPDRQHSRRLEVARKAAWFSLGFMLREAAKVVLDVQSRELRVGVRVRPINMRTEVEIFLADELENGAGYATHLGKPEVFTLVLDSLKALVSELGTRPAHADCETSCYECLRDYHNMPYHPALDWRLGRDMANLLRGGSLDASAWIEAERRRAQLFADAYGGQAREFGPLWGVAMDACALLVTHPLENQFRNLSQRIAEAEVEAESAGYGELTNKPVIYADSFNLLRRPGLIALDTDRL
jgi:hypothetical protein